MLHKIDESVSGMGLITLCAEEKSPPLVEAESLQDLEIGFDQLVAEKVKMIVIEGNPMGFGAGANTGMIMDSSTAELNETVTYGHVVFNKIEDALREHGIPVVAMIRGNCLGGSNELALACHFRIVEEGSNQAQPEVPMVGIIPGLGACYRYGKLVGLMDMTNMMSPLAYPAICMGIPANADIAVQIGLADLKIDKAESEVQLQQVAEFVRRMQQIQGGFVRRQPVTAHAKMVLVQAVMPYLQGQKDAKGMPEAPTVAAETIAHCMVMDNRDQALRYEKKRFLEQAATLEARGCIQALQTRTSTKKMPKDLPKVDLPEVVAVHGAGFMGGPFVAMLLKSYIRGLIKKIIVNEASEKNRASLLDRVLKYLDYSINTKHEFTEDQVREAFASGVVADKMEDTAEAMFHIEAIFEDPKVKEEFYRALSAIVKPGAILASNSSSFGPNFNGQFVANPESVIGLHGFSPFEQMLSVEVVKGDKTSDEAVAIASAVVLAMGKNVFLLNDKDVVGFFVNSVLEAIFREVFAMWKEGTSIEAIDAAISNVLMPMGPFTLGDLVGLKVVRALLKAKNLAPDWVHELMTRVVETEKRQGKLVTQSGFYNYPDGSVWEGLADGVERGTVVLDAEAIERRFVEAAYKTAQELVDKGVVEDEAIADSLMITCTGYGKKKACYGGPINTAKAMGMAA